VEQTTRADIAASLSAHRDLGADYTDAVSEGLVERIGLEIDKRVDAKLAERRPAPPTPRAVAAARAHLSGSVPLVICVGSVASGLAASLYVLFAGQNSRLTVVTSGRMREIALIWAVVIVVNVACARRHR